MKIADEVKMKGRLVIEVTGPDGKIKDRREVDNLVVTTGRNYVASRMKDATANAMSHMAIGTGVTAAALGDTTLQTELARVALAVAGGSVAANVVTYSATFPAGTGTGAITEAGILNASSAGTLLARVVFSVVNKGAADAMTISWAVTAA